MKLAINASFTRKPSTGIGQVTVNFLKKLNQFSISNSQFSQKIQFVLYLEEDLPTDFKLSDNFSKRILLPPWKRDDLIRKIWWEKYVLPQKAREDDCDAFLSLYQCPTIIKGMRHVMLVHDIIPELFPEYLNNMRKKYYWRLTKKSIFAADRIITVSHRTEKDLVQHLGLNPDSISVCRIDVSEIFKKEVSEKKSLQVMEKYDLHPGYIYFGGGLEKRKNAEGLLKAYQYLREKNKKVCYVSHFPDLVVSGKLMPQLSPLITDVEKLAKKMNISPFVKILGFVPEEDLPALYKNAVFFVYPSFYEGFGLPVLEAMNVGTPVITSKKSSLPEIGSDAALYFLPNDVEDMAMVMKNLLVNSELRKKMIKRGHERARYFSWERFCEKTLNIIHEN